MVSSDICPLKSAICHLKLPCLLTEPKQSQALTTNR